MLPFDDSPETPRDFEHAAQPGATPAAQPVRPSMDSPASDSPASTGARPASARTSSGRRAGSPRRSRRSGRLEAPAPGQRPSRDTPSVADDGPPADPESVARIICLRLLATAPRTRGELAAALGKRAVPAEAAEAVLARFDEVGLIDDAAFAAAWVETRHRGRGLARGALARELARRGVDRETVDDALDRLDPAEEERTAHALVVRRAPGTRALAPEARARRLVGMLARKGYPPAVAFGVVREVLEAEGAAMPMEEPTEHNP